MREQHSTLFGGKWNEGVEGAAGPQRYAFEIEGLTDCTKTKQVLFDSVFLMCECVTD